MSMLVDLLIDTMRLGAQNEGGLASRWQAVRTQGLPELVAYEGGAIWLFRRLRAVDALAALPADVAGQLREQAFEAAALRMEVEAEAAVAVALLEHAMIPVVLIKGLARCALAERYPYLDARATHDVDLLVPHDRIVDADRVLRADGYFPALPVPPAGMPRHHHLPPLHKGRTTVELHDSTSTRVPPEAAWTRANAGSQQVQWAGRLVRIPSVTELAWNAIAHAMEDEVGGFRLSRFLEVAALVGDGAQIDWEIIRERSVTEKAVDSAAGALDQQLVIRNWVGAALALVAADRRPLGLDVPVFDLANLLAWRLAVLRVRPRIGRPLAGRLLAEGARTLVGLPREGSPPTASPWGRVQRPIAGRVSRIIFGVWRLTA